MTKPIEEGTTPRQMNIPNKLHGDIFLLNKQENEKRKKAGQAKLNTTEEMVNLLQMGYEYRVSVLEKENKG
jgi:predicted transcriptional regulator